MTLSAQPYDTPRTPYRSPGSMMFQNQEIELCRRGSSRSSRAASPVPDEQHSEKPFELEIPEHSLLQALRRSAHQSGAPESAASPGPFMNCIRTVVYQSATPTMLDARWAKAPPQTALGHGIGRTEKWLRPRALATEKPQITRMNADQLGPDNRRLSALSAVCSSGGWAVEYRGTSLEYRWWRPLGSFDPEILQFRQQGHPGTPTFSAASCMRHPQRSNTSRRSFSSSAAIGSDACNNSSTRVGRSQDVGRSAESTTALGCDSDSEKDVFQRCESVFGGRGGPTPTSPHR